jgi:hypothetical protein
VFLHDVLVSQVSGDGIHQVVDASSNQPDGWHGVNVWSRYNTGNGFTLRAADSTWTDCLSSNNGGDGWNMNTTGNNHYTACRAEHDGANGWHYYCSNASNAAGKVLFTGCGTDQATLHGFLVDGAASSAGVPLNLTGCYFRRDGQNGGSGGAYAGIAVTGGYSSFVHITGTTVFPGVNDNGSGVNAPEYGLLLSGANQYVGLEASHLHSTTAPVSNDGNTVMFQPGRTMSYAIGTSASPANYRGGTYSIVKPTTTTATNSATPAADPALTTTLPPGTAWRFAFSLMMEGTAANNIQLGVITPSGATLACGPSGLASGSAATTGNIDAAAITGSGTQTLGLAGTGTPTWARLEGTVTVGATPGTFALSWAQGTAGTSTSASIMAGSSLTMEQVS